MSKDRLAEIVVPSIIEVYRALDCQTEFVTLSGRLAILAFIEGKVDGEAFRLEAVEAKYSHDYVKSSVPLFPFLGSLWMNPNDTGHRPFGYALGIVWEENYAKGKKAVALRDMNRKVAAYNNGIISGFLMTDITAQNLIKEKKLNPIPLKKAVLLSRQSYHYLHRDYAEFMQAFSRYVQEKSPFLHLIKDDFKTSTEVK